jgi:hypothetical protein
METHLTYKLNFNDLKLKESEATLWAESYLEKALESQKCFPISSAPSLEISIFMGADTLILSQANLLKVNLPTEPESCALFCDKNRLFLWGRDIRGVCYALTEIADRLNFEGFSQLDIDLPCIQQPSARVRSIARLFCSEEEDMPWFIDRQFWAEYLDMLAVNRINRFNLTLGMGYNYPYHNNYISDVYFYFPYPFLLEMPNYPVAVKELSTNEINFNLETLKFIAKETTRRGIDFHLALWTQRYDFDDVPNARHTVVGITDDNLAPYCRDALTKLLTEIPEIKGLTFRVHVEGGIAEGDYDFWKQAFAGVAAAGRPVEIDMHGKGLDHVAIGIARDSGMPIATSPKYLAEHMGLPYHQSAIRMREYPPETARSEREQLSEGSRKFLRYSYGDLLSKNRDWKVVYRIWAGTQRLLIWGDPEFAAGYGRSSIYCGSDGVELCEPGSFKGRMGTGFAGQRYGYQKQNLVTKYDFQKYAYQYRVWGRLLYCPTENRSTWMRYLNATCADAAQHCESALKFASRVLPLISLTHGPSASNNHYWPEIYSNLPIGTLGAKSSYGYDMDAPVRFGNAPTFDYQLFSTPKEYAQSIFENIVDIRYSPFDVATWFEYLSDETENALQGMKSAKSFHQDEVQRIFIDSAILAANGRFFAHKFRASVYIELFLLSNASLLIDLAYQQLKSAHKAWEDAVAISQDVYHDDLTFGPQTWLRGSWKKRLQDIENEMIDIQYMKSDAPYVTVPPTPKLLKALDHLNNHTETRNGEKILISESKKFKSGSDFEVEATVITDHLEHAVLHYRHVNQAERWKSMPMVISNKKLKAKIDSFYTKSDFHLQFYITAVVDGQHTIAPGLNKNLSNEPYCTVLQM